MEKLTIALYLETNNNDEKSFRGYQNCLMISTWGDKHVGSCMAFTSLW